MLRSEFKYVRVVKIDVPADRALVSNQVLTADKRHLPPEEFTDEAVRLGFVELQAFYRG